MPNLEQIKRELKKYNFAYEENVLPVHTNGHYFLYGFYEKGIAILHSGLIGRLRRGLFFHGEMCCRSR